MKALLIFLLIGFISCSPPEPQEAGVAPSGTIVEPFGDASNLSKAMVNDASGNMTRAGTLKDGMQEGSWVEYHTGGLVKSVTSYVDGKKEGIAMELNTNGQLEKKMEYHNDQLDGKYVEFRFTTIKEERNYKSGKLEGVVKIYYDNGKIMEEGAYQNGTRDGISKWYDQEGNVTIEYEYKNGELIKK